MERGWTAEACPWPVPGPQGLILSLLPGSYLGVESWVQFSWALIPGLIPANLLWDFGQVLSLSKSMHVDDFISYHSVHSLM